MSADLTPFTEYTPDTAITPYGPGDYTEGTAIELTETPTSAPAAEQGIVIGADGSVSMADILRETGEVVPGLPPRTKSAAATVAIGELVSLLQSSRIKENFSLGFLAFHERVVVDRPIRALRDLSAAEDFDPTQAGTGGTCVYAALDAAYDQIVTWRQGRSGSLHVSNVVCLFTDGLCSDPQRTLAAAARLKELPNVTVAACLLAGVGDPTQGGQLLQHVASGPSYYRTVHTAAQLRDFFLASITRAGQA